MTSLHGYPRPQMKRAEWYCLDGEWEFSLDPDSRHRLPDEPLFERRIRVPFAPEAPLSRIHFTGFFRSCWYRTSFETPALQPGDRLLLHFGAVDYRATVWINGHAALEHEGGYTPFFAEITGFLNPANPQTIVVCAEDDPADLSKPRGKQDWQLEPHAIWYPRTSGIWQSVWMERVPATYIGNIRWTPNVERWEIGFETRLEGERREGLRMNVKLTAGVKGRQYDRANDVTTAGVEAVR